MSHDPPACAGHAPRGILDPMSPVAEITTLEVIPVRGKAESPEDFAASFDLARVPTAPGCYQMLDKNERIMYVGKAANLRARVRSYIHNQDSRYSVRFLMRRVTRINFLVTTNEKEALLLENSLIKEHKPRYNISLKDDKTYVSVKLNVMHEWPRLTVTRKLRKDGSRYYGPYASAAAVRQTLRELQRIFPLRTCSDNVLRNRTRPCLYYQMKQCVAPCVGLVEPAEYEKLVAQVAMALEGRSDELVKQLKAQIQQHAEALEFESAALLRDRLYAVEKTLERQRTVDVPGAEDRDVFGIYTEGRYCEFQVVFFRGGKLLGGRSFSFRTNDLPMSELFASFLLQYYGEAPVIPREVLIPLELEEAGALGDILTEKREAKVTVLHPQRGEKLRLIELAEKNAKSSFEEKRLRDEANLDLMKQLREKLHLPREPKRIECFDIATTQGDRTVGSMVVFDGGNPDKARYRHYTVKTVEGTDDFASMREVLLRRYTRAVREDDLPDLVLVDGGKGQLGMATAVMQDLGIEDLPLAGIAKSRAQESGKASPERFYIPGRMNPIILPQHSPVVLYLARIRDEAHRFANTFHAKKRSQGTLRTALTDIPGIGPKRARTLLSTIGSLAKIRETDIDTIAAVPGFNQTLAKAVKDALTKKS